MRQVQHEFSKIKPHQHLDYLDSLDLLDLHIRKVKHTQL